MNRSSPEDYGDYSEPPEGPLPQTSRQFAADICKDASELIGPGKERELTHGTMEESLGHCAAMWSAYLRVVITPGQVAGCIQLLKLSRIETGDKTHRDHYVDMAGYAGLQGALNCRGNNSK